jgi:adenosylmethionine-8-amino-7-oxononanoate aminotransferase
MKTNESVEDYVVRLAQELEDEFQRLGPDTVCAFVAETMTGAVRIPYLTLLPMFTNLFK